MSKLIIIDIDGTVFFTPYILQKEYKHRLNCDPYTNLRCFPTVDIYRSIYSKYWKNQLFNTKLKNILNNNTLSMDILFLTGFSDTYYRRNEEDILPYLKKQITNNNLNISFEIFKNDNKQYISNLNLQHSEIIVYDDELEKIINIYNIIQQFNNTHKKIIDIHINYIKYPYGSNDIPKYLENNINIIDFKNWWKEDYNFKEGENV